MCVLSAADVTPPSPLSPAHSRTAAVVDAATCHTITACHSAVAGFIEGIRWLGARSLVGSLASLLPPAPLSSRTAALMLSNTLSNSNSSDSDSRSRSGGRGAAGCSIHSWSFVRAGGSPYCRSWWCWRCCCDNHKLLQHEEPASERACWRRRRLSSGGTRLIRPHPRHSHPKSRARSLDQSDDSAPLTIDDAPHDGASDDNTAYSARSYIDQSRT